MDFRRISVLEEKKMTYKDMCELISEYWAWRGYHKTWKEIWGYSPTGEINRIVYWYEEAKEWKESMKK